MRHATFGVIVLTATVLLCAPARADFTGLVAVREFTNQLTVAGPRDVFRVYAEFTSATDRVNSWFGTAGDPFMIQNILSDGSLGSGFTNFGTSISNLPPEIPGTPLDWDTWATIGITNGAEGENGVNWASLSLNFPAFIPGNTVTGVDASISVLSEAGQGLANWRVQGQDTALRVLLMQLVVLPGEHVQGQISVGGRIDTGSGYEPFVAAVQTFNSVPGPGGLAMMAWPAWWRTRHRLVMPT